MSDTVSKKAIKSIIKTGRIIITFSRIDSANSHAYNFRASCNSRGDRFSSEKNSRKEGERKKRKEKEKKGT